MQNRPFLIVIVSGLLLALGACQSTSRPATEPGHADVVTAGWETPSESTAAQPSTPSAEAVRLREENRRMQEKLRELSKRVEALKEKPAPVAEVPEEVEPVMEPPRPTGEIVAATIRRASIPDLDVDVNRDGEALVRLAGSMAFCSGQATLREQARSRLGRLGEVLRREFPDVRLRVEGHTDSDPIRKSSWSSNEALSMARAKSVASFLSEKVGWPEEQIRCQGYGAERPIASNATREGKAQNRRIEIVLETP